GGAGLFSYYLLQGLAGAGGKTTDANGWIRMAKLKDYVEEQVIKHGFITGNSQHPYISGHYSGKFWLGRIGVPAVLPEPELQSPSSTESATESAEIADSPRWLPVFPWYWSVWLLSIIGFISILWYRRDVFPAMVAYGIATRNHWLEAWQVRQQRHTQARNIARQRAEEKRLQANEERERRKAEEQIRQEEQLAKQRVEIQQAFSQAQILGTEAALQAFLKKYPHSEQASAIKEQLAKLRKISKVEKRPSKNRHYPKPPTSSTTIRRKLRFQIMSNIYFFMWFSINCIFLVAALLFYLYIVFGVELPEPQNSRGGALYCDDGASYCYDLEFEFGPLKRRVTNFWVIFVWFYLINMIATVLSGIISIIVRKNLITRWMILLILNSLAAFSYIGYFFILIDYD
ncbi:hypothetical protein TI05_09850, partial [Achromatium sp. WMS3]